VAEVARNGGGSGMGRYSHLGGEREGGWGRMVSAAVGPTAEKRRMWRSSNVVRFTKNPAQFGVKMVQNGQVTNQ
jgi:hypothetical protein